MDIQGYEGLYQVSDMGRIRSLPRTIIDSIGRKQKFEGVLLKGSIHEEGYPLTLLKVGGEQKIVRNHRMVAKAFIPNPHGYPEVNHLNGIRDDNRVQNLEWCTSKQNSLHAVEEMKNFGEHTGKPRGISFHKKMDKWMAYITYRKQIYYLGYHDLKTDAYKAYFEKFVELRGFEPWNTTEYQTH